MKYKIKAVSPTKTKSLWALVQNTHHGVLLSYRFDEFVKKRVPMTSILLDSLGDCIDYITEELGCTWICINELHYKPQF